MSDSSSSSSTGANSNDSSSSSSTQIAHSTPSSFFTSSISSSDSAYHRIAVLLCPGCRYLEFPGCLMHNGLLANIKGNGYMSCSACELDRKAKGGADVPGGADNVLSMVCATDTAEPWSVACQHCNIVKADTIPWIIADRESVGLSASMEFEKEDVMPHTVIQCEQCKTSMFPLVNGRLTRRHLTDPNLQIYHPDEPTKPLPIEQFGFKHYVSDCIGKLITIPIQISKLEGKFCGQSLPASPYLPLDSSFVPGFIPPLEWLTGEEHKAHLLREEYRKEKYVLSRSIGHRTPIWRDKAYIGVFGDPFVRDTELEGGHIAESIDAMHWILNALYQSSGDSAAASSAALPFDFSTASWFSTFSAPNSKGRSALKQVIDTLQGSMDTIHYAKDALDALVDKDMKDSDKAQFSYRVLKKWRLKVRDMKVGDVFLLPGGWIAPKAGHAIMHILFRYEHSYSFVTCNTGGGLAYHPSSVSEDGGKFLFRTSFRIDNITRERILDDAFWLLFWRLQTVQSDDHDHHVLYEILLPTLGDKPLAESLTQNDPHAEWRTPQRAGNCYLKCVIECIRYLSRAFGMTKAETKQSALAQRRLFMKLCMNDLTAHRKEMKQVQDLGDDKARRKRQATKLQEEMKQEKIPEKINKKTGGTGGSSVASNVLAPNSVENELKNRPLSEEEKSTLPSTVLNPHSSSVPVNDLPTDLPLIDILSEPLTIASTPLHDDSDLTMVRLSTKQTAHAAIKEAKKGRLTTEQMKEIYAEIQQIEQTMTQMPIQVLTSTHVQPKLMMEEVEDTTFSLDGDADPVKSLGKAAGVLADGAAAKTSQPSPFEFSGFDSFPLMLEQHTRDTLDKLAGKADPEYTKNLLDYRLLYRELKTLDDILLVFQHALDLAVKINPSHGDSLNGYYSVLALIQGVLTSVPIPGSSAPRAEAWFTRQFKHQEQVELVKTLGRLGRHYMAAECSIESPAFVTNMDRTVAMWTLVTIADWTLRRTASDRAGDGASSLSKVMNGGDGLYPFYAPDLCNGAGKHVREMIANMQASTPETAHLYGELVEYWNELEQSAKASGLEYKSILPFRNSAPHQTTMFQENDSTLNFIRDIAKQAGYIIEKRGYAGKETSEIEAVARWLFAVEEGEYSMGGASYSALIPQLSRDHPEFPCFRDLVFLFKLALVQTHPTSRIVLPGRYVERDACIYWTTQGMPMSNEMVIIYAKSFAKKEIMLIKTREIESYATPDAYLPQSAKGSAALSLGGGGGGGMGGLMGMFGGGGGFGGFGAPPSMLFGGGGGAAKNAEWSEEDIIHNTSPQLFDNLLSIQSSEALLSVLTAPYLRIPLVLAFFSSRDRVDLLADRRLARLLMAVLFENAQWASGVHEKDVEEIPFAVKQSGGAAAAPAMNPMMAMMMPQAAPPAAASSESTDNKAARIGSPYGLLLNELCTSAGATLNPFLTLLVHGLSLDTGYFSTQSSTCKLILYLARIACKMESFVRHALISISNGSLKSSSPINTHFLQQSHTDLLHLLLGPFKQILLTYKSQAMQVISEAVWVMATLAMACACGVELPEYVLTIKPSTSIESALSSTKHRWSPSRSFPSSSMIELLGSFSFVLTWHSMGIGIGKNLEEDETEGVWNKANTLGGGGGDIMAQLTASIQQSMNASKLKKAKKEDEKEKEKSLKQSIPEMELFQTLQSHRSLILSWFESISRSEGGERTIEGVFDQMVEWVHGHKMQDETGAVGSETDEKKSDTLVVPKSSGGYNPQLTSKKPDLSPSIKSSWTPLQNSGDKHLSSFTGRYLSSTRRLEIDLHTTQITFYDHDVFPVHDLIARHEDFLSVFGTDPQHYAMIESRQHRQLYGVFGSNYTLAWWDRNLAGECVNQPVPAKTASTYNINAPGTKDSALPEGKWKCGSKGCQFINPFSSTRCELCSAYQPMLSSIEKYGLMYCGIAFTRRYGSTYLAKEEAWIVELLEPLLRTLFSDELDTLNYSLWMREELWKAEDDKVCLIALDASTYKQIVLYRTTKLIECYNLLEHGRTLYRSLTYTSNGRLSLGGLPTDDAFVRMKPWEEVDRYACGQWEEVQKKTMSFVMKRVRHIAESISVEEVFLSPPLLAGLLPKVLLEHYHFYLVENVHYQSGSNHLSEESHAFDWFQRGDILGFVQKPYRAMTQWQYDVHIKLVPNTDNGAATATGWDRYHAIISQVTRGAAGSIAHTTSSLTPGSSPSLSPSSSPSPSPSPPLSSSPSPDSSPSTSPMLGPLSSSPFQSVLLNMLTCTPGSFLSRLAKVLMRVEDLSHVLVWSRTNEKVEERRDCRRRRGGNDSNGVSSSSEDQSYRILRIDLPRLKLSFRPRRVTLVDGTQVWRLYSNDHAGFYISDTQDAALGKLLYGIPNSLLLENARAELWLIVPNTPLRRPQIMSCPFSNELVANRADPTWARTMDTRFYVYQIHVSHTFLLANTLASTFYLLLLSLFAREYEVCARYCETCEIDTLLTAEERYIFQLFEHTLHDQHPDAHAIRLKLYMCVWLSGEPIGWKSVHGEAWSLEDEYTNYIKKLMHVSAVCRLTNEEEEAIYQQISYEEGQKNDSAPNEQQNRASIRGAITKHFAAAGQSNSSSSSAAGGASSSEADPPRIPMSYKPPKREGLTTLWWTWQSQLTKYFSQDWTPGMWSGMVCYSRPSRGDLRDIELLDTVGDAINDTMIGSMHKYGFLFLVDCLLGGVEVRVDTQDQSCEDCSFSLGRLLTQFQYLKTTQFGKEVKPGTNYLPFAVNAVFGSGFIPTRHNMKWRRPTSIPAFPPLPQVPYQGVEAMMSSGFLLHRAGTPINQFFTLLAQWSAGFVRMCAEWTQYCNRPAVQSEAMTQGYVLLKEWPSGSPKDTSCGERRLDVNEKRSEFKLDAKLCDSLVAHPLAFVDLDKFLSVTASTSTALSTLPFDVSSHPSALTYVARSMLTRMDADMGEYSEQVKQEKSYHIAGVTTQELLRAIRERDGSGVQKNVAALRDLHAQLTQLRAQDWTRVHDLRALITTLANSVPDITTSETASNKSLQYILSRYAGQSFTLQIDYLTAALLSSKCEDDVRHLNPYLSQEAIAQLTQLLPVFLLVHNRIGLLDRLLFEVDELRGSLLSLNKKISTAKTRQALPLVRSLSGGTVLQSMNDSTADDDAEDEAAQTRIAEELNEMANQLGVQSETLAENLRAGRHYMTPDATASSSTTITSYSYDPRFLVFEYIFNILLRRMQVELILTFAKAAWKKQSLVQQMIMGAGKTTVVGPLLALMLADGESLVTMVVPSALLPMSRSVLRARFSSIVPKRIHTFEYDRSTRDDPKHVAKLLYKLYQARKKQGIIIATSVSVKSMMLKYLELLVALQTTNYDSHVLTASEQQQLQVKSAVIDGLSQIMSMWRSGILILDEIDLLLHPLKSELNFPCGAKIPLQPTPNRWTYPMHLLDAFFYHDTGYLSMNAFYDLPEAQAILSSLHTALKQGQATHMLQMLPHLILLNQEYYHTTLKPILAKWSLIWLKAKGVASEIPDAILLEYMTKGWASEEVHSLVTALLNQKQMVLLNLAYNWLNSFLVHVLSKINRVSYGLLKEEEMEGESMSLSRRLVAVPFLAKDVPSRSSEFAQSEVIIGLTILAYKIEGLRKSDLRHLVSTLKNSMSQEMGPEYTRPSAKLFDEFVREAKVLQERKRRKEEEDGVKAMKQSKKKKGVSFHSSTSSLSSLKILPLAQFSLTDPSQLSRLYTLVHDLPHILDYYLTSYLFPTCMNHQVYNLSASGQELGNGVLFQTSLGFSGTPSDLLPLELGKCHYEKGSDGKVCNILTSSQIVSYSIKYDWNVHSLLRDIATAKPSYHSLIDTGALITGMENYEVASFLLEYGLKDMEGVLYLDKNDQQMILLRTGGGQPIPASQCGVAPHKRFSFYDQIHTTGIDLKHSVNAVAVMTLGKDMTFRDYAQGAFRMRQIGMGQKIHLFVIPEVLKLIERELSLSPLDSNGSSSNISTDASSTALTSSNQSQLNPSLLSNLPTHVAAWLTINSMRMEQLQFFQLCLQNLHSVWRKRAFADLLRDSTTQSAPAQQAQRHLRYDLNRAAAAPSASQAFWLHECINLFKQPISYDIEDHIPVYKPFFAELKSLISQHTTFIKENEQCLSIAAVLTQALEAAQSIIPKNSYDREMINEQEKEQEQEKHQEVLRDPRAQRAEEEHRPWKIAKLKESPPLGVESASRTISSDLVVNTTSSHPFYSLSGFSLEGRPLPLSFPKYLMMSHNYYRQSWGLNPNGHRRLKNVYVVMEWCANGGGGGDGKETKFLSAASSPAVSSSSSSSLNSTSDRAQRLFSLLDTDRDGRLSRSEANVLIRVLSNLLDEDLTEECLFTQHAEGKEKEEEALDKEEVIRLIQAIAKRQDARKVAGFVETDESKSNGKEASSSSSSSSSLALRWLRTTSSEESDRYFVILPLSEAQALRRAVHTNNPLFRDAKDVQFALWSLDGHLIETTQHYRPAKVQISNVSASSTFQLNLSLQTARFMNGELYYTDEELVSLLRGISGIHSAHRRTLVDQLLLCRHRDHRTIEHTPLERVLHFTDDLHWLYVQTLLASIRARIDAKGLSLLQAFHHFDMDGNGRIDASELWTALHYLGFAIQGSSSSNSATDVISDDVMDVIRYGDVNEDSALDFEEWTRCLMTREEMKHQQVRVQKRVEERRSGVEVEVEEESKSNSSNESSAMDHNSNSSTQSTLTRIPFPPLRNATPPPTYRAPSRASISPAPTVVPHQPPPAAAAVQSPWSAPAAPVASQQPRSPPVVSTVPWSCSVCTYQNSAGRTRCEMCDTPK